MALFVLSLILVTMIQDSTCGPDPPKLNCDKWKGRDAPLTLLSFIEAASRRLNCYRAIVGLPELKRALNHNNVDENALINRAESAISDVVIELISEQKGNAGAGKASVVSSSAGSTAKANKQSPAAAQKVADGATSLTTYGEVIGGGTFVDYLLLISIDFKPRKQYGQSMVISSTDDWKAILSSGITKVTFYAACLPHLNKFVAVAQYDKPIDKGDEKLEKARQTIWDSKSKLQTRDPCEIVASMKNGA